MKFSIVVPTYNEERDIGATLDALLELDWPDVEILVVDDSTDSTPDIVCTYADRGVHLVRPKEPEGRCGARNLGILQSNGEVVVILNADVRLPSGFLNQLASHYVDGYDYVLVRSQVENIDDLFARYVECVGVVEHYRTDPSWMEWSEGFSCRRELAIRAGMFPVGFVVPICAGEDGYFGKNLRKLGARKKIDLNIVVRHVAPATLSEYWRIREGRGRGSPQIRRFLQRWSFTHMTAWATLRLVKTALWSGLMVPMLYLNYQAARESPRGMRDWLPFCYAWLIEQIAFHVGEWRSISQIYYAERSHRLAHR